MINSKLLVKVWIVLKFDLKLICILKTDPRSDCLLLKNNLVVIFLVYLGKIIFLIFEFSIILYPFYTCILLFLNQLFLILKLKNKFIVLKKPLKVQNINFILTLKIVELIKIMEDYKENQSFKKFFHRQSSL